MDARRSGLPVSRQGKAVIVGAVVLGLVAAVELASAYVEVVVVEKALAPGGKLRRIQC